MQTSKNHFEAKVVFNDETIRRMFRTEFYTYEGLRHLLWLAAAFVLVMAALFTAIPTFIKVLCLLVGCAMFAMPDFLSRVAAEGVIMQRGGAETTVRCRVNDGGVDVENGAHIPFAKVLAKETGKDWQRSKSLWGLNLKDLIQMGKDRFQRSAS